MDGLELLDELEEVVAQGANVPFSGRCILERDELMDLIQELKLKLPADLKQAKWIKSERQRILQEAQAEALMEKLEEVYPDGEFIIQSGGQPLYYYFISVE